MKTKIDFLVVGASKSGTTSFFDLIKGHPQISIPDEKEVPYFSDSALFAKGLKWYLNEFFSSADPEAKWGTISPQYMEGFSDTSIDVVVSRIHNENPDTLIIAILRHPVQRAYSQYKMFKQRGKINLSFEELVDDLLRNEKTDRGFEKGLTEYNSSVLGGKYGFILNKYLEKFPKNHMLILFTEDLKEFPQDVVQSFFKFINLDNSYLPDDLFIQSRSGGSKPKVKFLTPGFMYSIPGVKYIWKNFIPFKLRKKVEYRLNLWNIMPDKQSVERDSAVYQRLVDYYKSDVAELKEIFDIDVPWDEFK